MILSEQIEIPKTEDLDSEYVESELNKLQINPLRWAIVEVSEKNYVLSVSYEK